LHTVELEETPPGLLEMSELTRPLESGHDAGLVSSVPISPEFRFASIYEEVRRIRDQTAQNDVSDSNPIVA
jgi:hypothetical protein